MKNELRNEIIDSITETTSILFSDYMEIKDGNRETIQRFTVIIEHKLDAIYHFNKIVLTKNEHSELVKACLKAFIDG